MAATHSEEFKRDAVRIALTSGLTRRQVASDLGVGLSTLGKWIRALSDEAKAPDRDADLLRENERFLSACQKRAQIVGWVGDESGIDRPVAFQHPLRHHR